MKWWNVDICVNKLSNSFKKYEKWRIDKNNWTFISSRHSLAWLYEFRKYTTKLMTNLLIAGTRNFRILYHIRSLAFTHRKSLLSVKRGEVSCPCHLWIVYINLNLHIFLSGSVSIRRDSFFGNMSLGHGLMFLSCERILLCPPIVDLIG